MTSMATDKGSTNNKWVRVSARAHAVVVQIHGILQSLPENVKPTTYGDTLELILIQFLQGRNATDTALELVSRYNDKHAVRTLPVQSVSVNGNNRNGNR